MWNLKTTNNHKYKYIKNKQKRNAPVEMKKKLSGLQHPPAHRQAVGSIPRQGVYEGCGFDPWPGCVQEAVDRCLSLPPPSRSKIHKPYLWVRI